MLAHRTAATLLVAAASDLWVWALLAAAIVIVLVLPRRLARRSRILDDPSRRRTAEEELRHSMDRLLVELQETARDINATLDTKMITLNRLIEEADARIATLSALQREGSTEGAWAAAPQVIPPQEVTPPHDEEPDTEDARRRRELEREIFRLADEGKTELEIARLVDVPRGEVELVLSLRKTSDDPEHGAEDAAP